ncbi:MAG: hypothetical protein D3917_01910 [Candidatus Electrothrix sp. AX5]|nr:hypothetical protein [Candidatus Electrothrix sp. AX5]
MILPDIPEFDLYGVYERGIPNSERIVLKANQDVEMGSFGLLLGVKTINRVAQPINNRFFWFGEGIIKAGDWIHIYTSDGKNEKTTLANTDHPVYALYWGFETTVLTNELIVPILIRIDGVIVEKIVFSQMAET